MINCKPYLAVAITGVFTFSCDPCSNLDCNSSNYFGKFRIISAAAEKDLVFGSNSVYNKNNIKFYSAKGSDTTVFEYQPISDQGTGYDSVLYVYFHSRPATAYLRLSKEDVDTLNISYKTFESKCCGTITEIAHFRINNSVDSLPGGNIIEVRK